MIQRQLPCPNIVFKLSQHISFEIGDYQWRTRNSSIKKKLQFMGSESLNEIANIIVNPKPIQLEIVNLDLEYEISPGKLFQEYLTNIFSKPTFNISMALLTGVSFIAIGWLMFKLFTKFCLHRDSYVNILPMNEFRSRAPI